MRAPERRNTCRGRAAQTAQAASTVDVPPRVHQYLSYADMCAVRKFFLCIR